MKKILLFFTVTFVLLEIIIRVAYPYQDRLERILNILEQDTLLFWRHKSNSNLVFESANVKTNSQGFRANKTYLLKNKGDTVRIICLGASPTFGWGVKSEDAYPQQLEKILLKNYPQKHLEVINAGMIGYSSYQGLLFLKNKILRYSPDIITVAYMINDVDRHRFFRSDGKADKELVPLNPVIIILKNSFRKSRLYNLIEKFTLQLENKRMVVSGAHRSLELPKARVSAEDYQHNLEEIIKLARNNGIKLIFIKMPLNLPLPPYVPESSKEEAKRHISFALEFIKSNQHRAALLELKEAISLYLYLPEAYFYEGLCYENLKRYDVAEESFKKAKIQEAYRCRIESEKYNKIMEEVAGQYGVPLVDIASAFKKQTGVKLFVDPKFDPIHPNEIGHRIIAEEIYKEVIRFENEIAHKG